MNEVALHARARIDAHHHLWQLNRFPYAWLAPDSPPRPFGDHGALKRDYLLSDYLADISGAGIVGSVFVEANAGASGAGEIEWVDEVAGDAPLPSVAVGSVDLRRADVSSTLSQFRRSSRMRGIRMSLCWSERPEWRFIDGPDVMLAREFQSGLRALTGQGLVLDTLVVPGQLAQLADLASRHPDQSIVVDHLGTPRFESAADRRAWEHGMRECARRENVTVKLSGLWTLDHGWRPEVIAAPVRFVVDLFGPGRCMWGSNLPVEKLMCPLHQQIANLEYVLTDLSEGEKSAIFHDTAARVYSIDSAAEGLLRT